MTDNVTTPQNDAQAKRIQTSVLNAAEKKALVWLAERQPAWMTSDILTGVGVFGAVLIAIGYVLSLSDIRFLWLSSFGFVVNWYGDSLDGTLARVRNTQRPKYGYYLDHTIDAINEMLIFVSIGLSGLLHLEIALFALIFYLLMTINTSINAHLKKEFRLTYAKMGPTEFRIILIVINTLFVLIRPLREFSHTFTAFGREVTFGALDYIGIFIVILLAILHIASIAVDLKWYAKADPKPVRSKKEE